MAKKEEVLCADRDSLTGLADLGEEFIKAITADVKLADELGLDTVEIKKVLKEGKSTLRAVRKRVSI